MRRRTNLSINPKHIYIVCCVVCVLLIAVSFKFSKQLAPIKTAVGSVFTPMQSGINTIGDSLTDKFDVFADAGELSKENEKLKQEVKTLEGENRLLLEDKEELEKLREFYKMDGNYSNLPMVGARVVAKDPNNWFSTFKIDRGSNQGIEVNMNVVSSEGLVGIVCEVGKTYSLVRSIVDDKSNVTAVFKKSSQICNVRGDRTKFSEGKIVVEGISTEIEVNDGDPIYTSFESQKFYQDILIGYVDSVKVDSNNVTKTGLVTPCVNFEDLDTVFVITKLKDGLQD